MRTERQAYEIAHRIADELFAGAMGQKADRLSLRIGRPGGSDTDERDIGEWTPGAIVMVIARHLQSDPRYEPPPNPITYNYRRERAALAISRSIIFVCGHDVPACHREVWAKEVVAAADALVAELDRTSGGAP